MISEKLINEKSPCFQFKANFLPCTILQVTKYNVEKLEKDLISSIESAPHFFKGSSIIIDLEKIKTFGLLNFQKLKQILLENSMIPLGVRGGSEEQHTHAKEAGFLILPSTKNHSEKKKKQEIGTKMVTTPVRSGMQIYAKDSDLVVIASVSSGAELFADGNIHVYGPLRGRALAGCQGNMQARIFCRELEAELVSIAGYYLTKEDIQTLSSHQEMVQIYLENSQICISKI